MRKSGFFHGRPKLPPFQATVINGLHVYGQNLGLGRCLANLYNIACIRGVCLGKRAMATESK
jgi:hypothetical protein